MNKRTLHDRLHDLSVYIDSLIEYDVKDNGYNQRLKSIASCADQISNSARKMSTDSFDFGEISWIKQRPLHWLQNIMKFRQIRFYGFMRGKLFLGAIIANPHASDPEFEYKLIRQHNKEQS